VEKLFLSYNTIRNDALKLAKRIFDEGFIPDVIYVPLRGGAYMGNVISEFFKIINKSNKPVFYAAVVARSYTDIRKQDCIMIDGWTYDPQYLRNGDKVLFVDDIFDSGRTLNYLVDVILKKGIPRSDIKIAVHDYKRIVYKDPLPIQPDYYCSYHEITKADDEIWIHYLSHELIGLTEAEREQYYYNEDPELKTIFKFLSE
jgi:hypoxanthine phosphoribosyltransferase